MVEQLKRTPLYQEHQELGARIVPFAGFEMPVQYSGVVDEHLAVRQAAGLFDVSHMGEFELRGADALANVQRLTPNDADLPVGQAQYSALLTERGTFVDDILVYRRAEDRFLLVVNAANEAKDFAWVDERIEGDCQAENQSDQWSLLALQGPRALDCMTRLSTPRVTELGSFHFVEDAEVAGVPALVSRTGYTGEDGFELYVRSDSAVELWRGIMAAGAELGLKPCGLGARDTLRLEARLPLYGNDIDEEHTPLEAGLSFIVKLDKGEFLGRDVLRTQKEQGVAVRLRGFEMTGREIARHGYPVFVEGEETSIVTSGSRAPFLGKNIGLTYLPAQKAAFGTNIEIGVRGRKAPAQVVRTPFYRKPQS